MPARADELADARALVAEAFARHLAPPPEITVDAWAEEHRHLERGVAAVAGKFKHRRSPYLIEIERVLTDPAVRDAVIMKGAQTGGSEVGINWFCRQIQCDPGPLIWVTSTDEQVRKISRRRFKPQLERAPLARLMSKAKARGRDGDASTTKQISFDGGTLGIVSHGSPADLSSDPQRDAVCDEVDRWVVSTGHEGDAGELVKSRQTTFEQYGAKTLWISSPAHEGTSRIAQLYEDSDQRRYHVPCPSCGVLQELIWFGVREDGHKFGVRWDPDVPKAQAPATAYYQCEHCPARWTDAERWAATQPETGACWVPTKPFTRTAGFYIPGLLSHFVRLSDCVDRWLKATGKPAQQQTFWNLVMGLPFSLTAEKAPRSIATEAWDGFEVPAAAVLLLGFADVQADRIEVTVAGVDAEETLLPVEHLVLQGVTSQPHVWGDLSAVMMRKWTRSDGKQIALTAFGVDCGYEFERACDWAGQQVTLRCFAIKGVSRGIKEPIVRERVPGHAKGGRLFYIGNSDAAKLNLIQRLNLRAGPGRVRFPTRECFSDAYFEQLRSETLKRRYVRGYPVLEWHLRSGARNEALDCLAGVLAVMAWLNPALDVLALRNHRVTDAPPPPPPPLELPLAGELTPEGIRDLAAQIAKRTAEKLEAREAPSAPAELGMVTKRHSGAWYESGASAGGRRRRY